MTNIQTKQLSVIKKWIESAIPHLNANISVRLWNNEIIPFSPNSNTTIVLAINSADAIRKLIFKPKLMTVFELYSDGLYRYRRWYTPRSS